jgi:hypothetical protein
VVVGLYVVLFEVAPVWDWPEPVKVSVGSVALLFLFFRYRQQRASRRAQREAEDDSAPGRPETGGV